MEDLTRLTARLQTVQEADESVRPVLIKCKRIIAEHSSARVTEVLLKDLLTEVVKPLFSRKSPWRALQIWITDLLLWISHQYPVPGSPSATDSHLQLLVPPILTLLEDHQVHTKQVGFQVLENVCSALEKAASPMLGRSGLGKIFEDALAPNMLMLPSLTPEDESMLVLTRLYPCYRALIRATGSHDAKHAMLDRMVRDGLLAGYSHASENRRISTLLLTELSIAIKMMGESSAKYLQTLLPLLRSILTNPFGASAPSLLHAAAKVLMEVITQCTTRITAVWWAECLRATIGLWYAIMDETGSEIERVKTDARGLAKLLMDLKPGDEGRAVTDTLLAEDGELKVLFA